MLTEAENFGKVKLAWYSIFEIRLANIESSWIKFRGEERRGGGGGGWSYLLLITSLSVFIGYLLSILYSHI